jgi:hypothetical protein
LGFGIAHDGLEFGKGAHFQCYEIAELTGRNAFAYYVRMIIDEAHDGETT